MDIVLLALIGLVLLLGLVAIGVGNKGWSWGTVAAAVLLLLAATGYIYLAARVAERERSWRALVTTTQKKIDALSGGAGGPGAAPAQQSLAALRHQRDRWMRALAFVDTWHGRSWEKASLTPPREGQPGTISIEVASDKSDIAPLPAGAEVAVFDNTDVANEGKFLGLFRVQAIKKGGEQFQLTVIPASFPTLPSDSDIRLWTRDYDHVTVYESLPVDRWLAFYKTPKEPGEDAAGGDSASDGRWRPQPRKIADKELLENLEGQMEGLQQHGETVPADKWPQLGKQLANREIMPGRYWATVEFTKSVLFTKKDGFTLVESTPEPTEGEAAEEGETPAEVGDAEDDSGIIGPTDADPTAAANSKLFTKKDFKEGDTAEFDLQTALELQNDKQFVRITSVVERRALADPLTAIRGTEFGAVDGYPVRAEGIDAIRQALLVEKAAIIEAMDRVASSRANVQAQADALAEEETELKSDLTKWRQDEATATATAKAFDDRFRAATIELAALETLIVRLGRELSDTWAVLTETIEATTR